jgi:DUF2911 family protein
MRKSAIYATLLVASISVLGSPAFSQMDQNAPPAAPANAPAAAPTNAPPPAPAPPPEDKSKRPSPPAHAEYKFPDGKMITIDYSSPRMRGRVIYGGLVPYGTEWRVGANEATTFVTDTFLNVGGTVVPPGSYTLFALPNADHWQLIISTRTGEWGIPYPGHIYDLARIDMKLATLPSPPAPLEDFTIGLDGTDAGCTLRLDWASTRVSVDIAETKITPDRR